MNKTQIKERITDLKTEVKNFRDTGEGGSVRYWLTKGRIEGLREAIK